MLWERVEEKLEHLLPKQCEDHGVVLGTKIKLRSCTTCSKKLFIVCGCGTKVLSASRKAHWQICKWAMEKAYEEHPNPAAQAILGALRKRKTREEEIESRAEALVGTSEEYRKPTSKIKTKRVRTKRTQIIKKCIEVVHKREGEVEGLKDLLLKTDPTVVAQALAKAIEEEPRFGRELLQDLDVTPRGRFTVPEAASLLRCHFMTADMYRTVSRRQPEVYPPYKTVLEYLASIPVPEVHPTPKGQGATIHSVSDVLVCELLMHLNNRQQGPELQQTWKWFENFPVEAPFQQANVAWRIDTSGTVDTLLLRLGIDEIRTKLGCKSEVVQLSLINEPRAISSPQYQTIIATWATETLKGPQAKQEAYRANLAPLISELRAIYQQPFQIGLEKEKQSASEDVLENECPVCGLRNAHICIRFVFSFFQ